LLRHINARQLLRRWIRRCETRQRIHHAILNLRVRVACAQLGEAGDVGDHWGSRANRAD